jgi:hypothetical protein
MSYTKQIKQKPHYYLQNWPIIRFRIAKVCGYKSSKALQQIGSFKEMGAKELLNYN